MTKALIYLCILVLTAICIAIMLQLRLKKKCLPLPWYTRLKLVISGFFASSADSLGIGSFTINIACAKFFNTFEDHELPGLINAAQVVPGAIEALFFLSLIEVETSTLIVLIIATCIGGLIGAHTIVRISQQTIRLAMFVALCLVFLLLLCNKLHWLPITGNLTSFSHTRLLIAFFAMIICGALTSVGVGLFVSTQAVMFLLDISPLIAFPIMAAASAIQQPLTTLTLIANNKVPLQRTLIITIAGLAGAACTLPIFTHVNISSLHSLLMLVICYNIIILGQSYLKHRPRKQFTTQQRI